MVAEERLQALLEQGEDLGSLNLSAVSEFLREADLDEDQTTGFFEQLEEKDIALTDDCARPDALGSTYVNGNLATATRVAILVPGSDTTLATFFSRGSSSPGGGALALAAQARRLDPGTRLAIIAWLGYPAPAMLSPGVLTSGDAGQGAQELRPLVLALARHGDRVALLCHSYGSVVCGLAAPHLPVTDIAVFGSPGMDASSVASLHTKARVWAGRESGDSIKYVPHIRLFGLGFGADPMSPGFGARIFATGTGGHSGYLDPGSVSLRSLTYIALGDPAAVTR